MKDKKNLKWIAIAAGALFIIGVIIPNTKESVSNAREKAYQAEQTNRMESSAEEARRQQEQAAIYDESDPMSEQTAMGDATEDYDVTAEESEYQVSTQVGGGDGTVVFGVLENPNADELESEIRDVQVSISDSVTCYYVLDGSLSEHYNLQLSSAYGDARADGFVDYDLPTGSQDYYYCEDGTAAEIIGVLEAASEYTTITDIYVEVDPTQFADTQMFWLIDYLANHMDTEVTFCFPVHSLDYWTQQNKAGLLDFTINSYYTFARNALSFPQSSVLFPEQIRWITNNQIGYDDESENYNEMMAYTVAYNICQGKMAVTKVECNDIMMDFRDTITEELTYRDLKMSGKNVAIFGDGVSLAGDNGYSIGSYLAGLSGANVYNYSVPGLTIYSDPFSEDYSNSLYALTNAVATHDFSILSEEMVNFETYVNTPQDLKFDRIIIQCGMQDYETNYPLIYMDDRYDYDMATVAGSLRSTIRNLRRAFPAAKICLVVPTHTSLHEEGTDTIEGSGNLEDYIFCMKMVASEFNSVVVDCYYDEAWDLETCKEYGFADGDPTDYGKYEMARFYLSNF